MRYGVREPERVGSTRLSGGRRVGWAEWGPPSGKPLLFFSGAGMGRELGFGAHLLERFELRLIAIERPGLGASEPAPNRTLLSFVDDMAELIALQRLRAPHVLGFSQGAPFALACAAGSLVSGVTIVSGQDDFHHPSTRNLADAHLAGLLDAIDKDPASVERSFASTDADTLLRFVLEGSSHTDLAVYNDPAFLSVYRRALRSGFAQGSAGYARDFLLSMSAWPFALSSIYVPVQLWYGERDHSKVHSPDFGANLGGRPSRARRNLLSDAGGSLLWTHTEAVLGAIVTG